jgi:hypothetical protein
LTTPAVRKIAKDHQVCEFFLFIRCNFVCNMYLALMLQPKLYRTVHWVFYFAILQFQPVSQHTVFSLEAD